VRKPRAFWIKSTHDRATAAYRAILPTKCRAGALRFSAVRIVGICAAMLAAFTSAHASNGLVDQATILNLQPTTLPNLLGQGESYFVYVNLSPGGQSCATYGQSSRRFVANPSAAAGMAVIPTLLTAFASGKKCAD
jgi:hypothetical protein